MTYCGLFSDDHPQLPQLPRSIKHLKVLASRCCPGPLSSAETLAQIIAALVETVGMTLLGPPSVHEVELDIRKLGRQPFEDEGGISVQAAGKEKASAEAETEALIAYGCLSTSHVAIHCWPLRGQYHLDLYSCRPYDARPVLEALTRFAGGSLDVYDLTIEGEE